MENLSEQSAEYLRGWVVGWQLAEDFIRDGGDIGALRAFAYDIGNYIADVRLDLDRITGETERDQGFNDAIDAFITEA